MSSWDLKRFALLADLADDERANLAACLEERRLVAEETLFEEGEEADALVLLAAGALRLSSSRTGEPGTLIAGHSLGCLALFRVGAREVTATAVDEARVLILTRSNYRRLAEDHPRTACRLNEAVLAQLAQRSRAALGALAPADG